jgi:transposase
MSTDANLPGGHTPHASPDGTGSTIGSELPRDVTLCHAIIRQLHEQLTQLQQDHAQLKHYVTVLLRSQYGPRSERLDPNQGQLFETAGSDASGDAATTDTAAGSGPTTIEVPKHRRKIGGRRPLPPDLPRERREYELPAEERACPTCHAERQKIGEETSEQLDFVPAKLVVIQHVRFKYACRHCQEHVAIAPKPPQPIEKGLPGPGLLATIITNKYGDHLPLYRLEEVFIRHGVELARSTMCGWMSECATLFEPLYDSMRARVLQSAVLHTDDTPVPVLDPTLPHTRQGRFWVYVGDAAHPYTIYDYTPSRARDGPHKFLKMFRGYLQADAFGGYDGIYLQSHGRILEVACWAHARRKFFDAQSSAPAVAAEALARIGQLYAVERDAAAPTDAHDAAALAKARHAARQQQSRPVLATLEPWLIERRRDVLPKSPIGQAIAYALSNWTALTRYVEDGRLAIDNNIAERALRGCAIGRKNWLFCGNDNGGRTAAILFSMLASAKRHGLEPFSWLRGVLSLLADRSLPRTADLLPAHWLATHPTASRITHE